VRVADNWTCKREGTGQHQGNQNQSQHYGGCDDSFVADNKTEEVGKPELNTGNHAIGLLFCKFVQLYPAVCNKALTNPTIGTGNTYLVMLPCQKSGEQRFNESLGLR
jgi:hypothetical protein